MGKKKDMCVNLNTHRLHSICATNKSSYRPVWFPGNAPPAHLDGSMPGDYGFDPLRLGSDVRTINWFREAELQHCRWAMLGVTGILLGEVVRPDIDFFSAPKQLEGSMPFSTATLLAIEFILFHYIEIRRWQDFKKPGSVDQDPIFTQNKIPPHDVGYPGGIFDPLGMSNGDIESLKVKEIKNGRLAMVAFVGFIAQELVIGKPPLAALQLHLSAPGEHTIFTNWAPNF